MKETGRDLETSSCTPTEVLSQHFPEMTYEDHKKTSGCLVSLQIQSKHLLNVINVNLVSLVYLTQ
jgi:hypothetical protein